MTYYPINLYHYFAGGSILGAIYFIVPNIVTKPIPILFLSLLCYFQYLNDVNKKYCKWVSIGLLFGSFGDICLELHNKDVNFFIFGLVFFLIGHLFYVKAFYDCGIIFRKEAVIPCVLSLSIFYITLMYFLLPAVDVVMIVPVAIYALTICTMVFLAVNRCYASFLCTTKPVICAECELITITSGVCGCLGALTFVCSDTILAINTFYAPVNGASISTMVTYYIAQILIAASCFDDNNDESIQALREYEDIEK